MLIYELYMSKKAKILIFLLLIFLALVLYLILTSESIENKKLTKQTNQTVKNENTASLEANYRSQAKEIFTAYGKLAQDNNSTADKVKQLKNQLLALSVPAKFKELHINFVLALVRLENYLSGQKQEEKNASRQIINQLKADYSWLNKDNANAAN